MAHCIVPAAEEILDKQFPVLDKGFVCLVDYMGDDSRIVQAARVSYGPGTKTAQKDAHLIDYLLRNKHSSPFEQVVLTFHAKMPIFVARQWVRHRMARLNEISGRYSLMPEEFYIPDLKDVSEQSVDNKQGRKEAAMTPKKGAAVRQAIQKNHETAYAEYKKILSWGTARELARTLLPINLYTQWYWQIDLHNLFHFLVLRLDPHAQMEIRAYAKVIRDLASRVCPQAFHSFEQHLEGGLTFSKNELEELRQLLNKKEGQGLQGKSAERFHRKINEGRQF